MQKVRTFERREQNLSSMPSRWFTVCLLCGFAGLLKAQDLHFSQFYHHLMHYSPARVGGIPTLYDHYLLSSGTSRLPYRFLVATKKRKHEAR